MSRTYEEDRPRWGKRLAMRILGAGFLFFLIKGLVWLAIGGLVFIGIF